MDSVGGGYVVEQVEVAVLFPHQDINVPVPIEVRCHRGTETAHV